MGAPRDGAALNVGERVSSVNQGQVTPRAYAPPSTVTVVIFGLATRFVPGWRCT